jgi:hypothetical protein
MSTEEPATRVWEGYALQHAVEGVRMRQQRRSEEQN